MNKENLRAAIPSLPTLDGRAIVRPSHAAVLLGIPEQTLRNWGSRGLVETTAIHCDLFLFAESILAMETPRQGRRPRKLQLEAPAVAGIEL